MTEATTPDMTYKTGRYGLKIPNLEHFGPENYEHNRDFAVHNLLKYLYFVNVTEPVKENGFSEISVPASELQPVTIIRAIRKRISSEKQVANREQALARERRDEYAGYSPHYGNPDFTIGSTLYEIVTLDTDSVGPPSPFISSEVEDRSGFQYSPIERATVTWRGKDAYTLTSGRTAGQRNQFYHAIMQQTVGMLRG